MGIELTKSAKRSIAKLYKSYLDRLRSGENKAQAVFFNNEKSDQRCRGQRENKGQSARP